MPRLTKLYTRKGDDGTTSLGGGQRVSKDAIRVHAYGSVDELNAALGVALSHRLSPRLHDMLGTVQNELFHLGTDLAFTQEDKVSHALPAISAKHVAQLEVEIDELNEVVGPLENFILPGGSKGSSHLHLARTVCRRAEREVIALAGEEEINAEVVRYLNRLSDLLFVAARYENHVHHVAEPLWDPLA